MKTFIVPTDFSETALNAAKFAIGLAANIPDCEVILYNVADDIRNSMVDAAIKANVISRQDLIITVLEKLQASLQENSTVKMRCIAEHGSLIKNLPMLVEKEAADLIVMGINGATRLKQVLMGSNTINIISETNCPVLIVPPMAIFNGIKNVLLSSDFKSVSATMPFQAIDKILGMLKPEALHIVNVDSEHYVELKDEYKREKIVMDKMFEDYKPDYAFLRFYDLEEGIDQYAKDKDIDMLITIPRKHSFLSKIFKTSYTRELAFHTSVPLLAVHN